MCSNVPHSSFDFERLGEELGPGLVHPDVQPSGPESWKVKCGVRRPEDLVPMTDQGTVIMRNGPASSRRAIERRLLQQTQLQANAPSIMPYAIDIDPEDFEEPARNSDAFGSLRRQTSQVDVGRTTTRASFAAGLFAGLATLAAGAAVAFVAFTSEPATAFGIAARAPHVLSHVSSSISVDPVETAELKAPPPKKKVHRVRTVAAEPPADDAVMGGLVGTEPAPAQPTDSE
jgi:hypothetical protein